MFSTSSTRDTRLSKSLAVVRLFIKSGAFDLAQKHLEEYLTKHPECSESFKLKQQICEGLGEDSLALEYYRKSLEAKKQQALNSSFDFVNSPNSKSANNNRNNTSLNMSINSTFDNSQTQQTNGNYSGDIKIDYQEIEKVVESKIKPLNDSIQAIQKAVNDIQNSNQRIFAAQDALQKFVNDTLKSDKSPKSNNAQESLQKLPNQINAVFSSLKGIITPLQVSVGSLESKHDNLLQRMSALKSEIGLLSTLVQERFERDDDEDYDEEEYNEDDHVQVESCAPKQNLCDMFKKPQDNWECPTCGTSNDKNIANCVCCEEKNPEVKSIPTVVSGSKFSFGIQPQIPPTVLPSVAISQLTNASSVSNIKSNTPPKVSFSFSQASGDLPKFGQIPVQNTGSIFGQTSFNGLAASPIGLTTTNTQETKKASPFSGNNFGNFFGGTATENTNIPPPVFGKPQEPTTTTLFGKPQEPSTTLFSKPKETSGGLFEKAPESTTGSLFGSKPTPPSSSSPSSSLFGTSNTTSAPLFGTSNKMFGGTVFSNPAQPSFSFNNISFTSLQKPEKSKQEDDGGSDKHPEEHEPEGVYKLPNVDLPEHYDSITGEEDEKVLFENRGKLHIHRDNEFKERGLGNIKVLKNIKSNKVRVLMRREHILKVCLNVRLEDIGKMEIIENKFLRFTAIDFSETEASTGVFLLRFSNLDRLKELKTMLETLKNDSVCDNFTDGQTEQNDDSEIEFVCKIDPTPEQWKKIEELKLPLNFYSLESSRKPCKGCRGCKDSDVVYQDTTSESTLNEQKNDNFFSNLVSNLNIPSSTVDSINTSLSHATENGIGPEDEHIVTTDFTSEKSKMMPVDYVVTTGEENETIMFSERSKLFRIVNGEYKERGLGSMKILKNKQNGFIRLLMRREQVHKVVCNHGIKNLKVQLHNTLQRAVNWVARDYSDSIEGSNEVFLLKFKTDEQAKNFVDKIHELQATL